MKSASDAKSARSLTELAYATLRGDLVACRLLPGHRLKIQSLCRRLSVSPAAVREALSRLTADGLVVSEAQKGFRVAPVSMEDLQDLTQTRIEIETMCLRRAIEFGGIEWETRVVAAYHRMSRTPERAPGDDQHQTEEWSEAHAEYHLALVSACNSAWLLRLRGTLFEQAERYRRLSVAAVGATRDVATEHRNIMEATLARRADEACRLLAEHFALTAKAVRHLAQHDPQEPDEPEHDAPHRRNGRPKHTL